MSKSSPKKRTAATKASPNDTDNTLDQLKQYLEHEINHAQRPRPRHSKQLDPRYVNGFTDGLQRALNKVNTLTGE